MKGIPEPEIHVACIGTEKLSYSSVCASSNQQRSKLAKKLCGLIILYLVLVAGEITVGLKSNSLALLIDATYLLTDIFVFYIYLFAISWETTEGPSFRFNRASVSGALMYVQLIFLLSGFLIYEAVDRFFDCDVNVNGKWVFSVAAIGSFINLVMITWVGLKVGEISDMIEEDSESNMDSSSIEETIVLHINIQGAYFRSIGVMIAGAIICVKPEWMVVDLICTCIFSVLVLRSTLTILRDMYGVMMEGTQRGIDFERLKNGFNCIKGVEEIQGLHVIRSITVGKIAVSFHVQAQPGVGAGEILNNIGEYCEKKYRTCDVTVQIE